MAVPFPSVFLNHEEELDAGCGIALAAALGFLNEGQDAGMVDRIGAGEGVKGGLRGDGAFRERRTVQEVQGFVVDVGGFHDAVTHDAPEIGDDVVDDDLLQGAYWFERECEIFFNVYIALDVFGIEDEVAGGVDGLIGVSFGLSNFVAIFVSLGPGSLAKLVTQSLSPAPCRHAGGCLAASRREG